MPLVLLTALYCKSSDYKGEAYINEVAPCLRQAPLQLVITHEHFRQLHQHACGIQGIALQRKNFAPYAELTNALASKLIHKTHRCALHQNNASHHGDQQVYLQKVYLQCVSDVACWVCTIDMVCHTIQQATSVQASTVIVAFACSHYGTLILKPRQEDADDATSCHATWCNCYAMPRGYSLHDQANNASCLRWLGYSRILVSCPTAYFGSSPSGTTKSTTGCQ